MSTPSLSLPRPAFLGGRALALPRPPVELSGLLLLAAVLYLWALDRNGFANDYYAAAVRSMSESWHAFLYGSFDSGGVMTVDKPPLSLWVQALSARLFGFSSWSVLVPQALMGVATVALAWDLVRRRFGRAAGFAAGLALALTPITVAIARHNNPDALLVLCCTAALWFVVRGLEDGRTRWLVLSGVCVGLGFEAKMAAALLVVPALAAAWLWIAPRGRAAAVRQLLAGGAAMTAVGLAWPLLVWLTPASGRPWVSGTGDNSIWSLILGYNGLGRLFGQDGGPGGGASPGGGVFGGEPGLLRLLNDSLGGQGGWLLGFALVAAVGLLAVTRLRRADPRTGWLLAVGGSFLVTAVAFSRAEGIFHPYYVSQLAPFTAALVGAGVGLAAGRLPAARLMGSLAVLAGTATVLVVLAGGELGWLAPLVAVGGLGAAAALATALSNRVRALVVAGALALLLIAPAIWSVQTLGHATSGTFPAGGPAATAFAGGPGGAGGAMGGPGQLGAPQANGAQPNGGFAGPPNGTFGDGNGGAPPNGTFGDGNGGAPPNGSFGDGGGGGSGGGGFGGNSGAIAEAVEYAAANGGGTVAVSSQSGAAGELITAGADVVGIGGFSGRESQVSVDWLADAVADGRIRWVLADGGGGMPQDGRIGASEVMAAVEQAGTPVSSVSGLYDLQGHADDLRALAS